MAGNWEKDACYAAHGVDGSKCSYLRYLSEVEQWCPPLNTSQPASRARRQKVNQLRVVRLKICGIR